MDPPSGTSGKALASLILGLLSPVGMFITGIPAMVLGLAGLRDVNASEGRLKGRRLAWAGMILGALGTLAFVAGGSAYAFLRIREASARATCENNLRVLGVALYSYHDRNGSFPAGTIPNSSLAVGHRLSWLADVLMYVEQEPGQSFDPNKRWALLASKLHRDQGWTAEANWPVVTTSVRGFVCPDWPERLRAGDAPGLTTYVGMAGLGLHAATLPAGDANAGVFGYDRKTRLDQVTRGTSETLMVAEVSLGVGPWSAGGRPTVRGLDPVDTPYIGPDRPFGGLHPGRAYVLLVDGSAAVFPENMAPEILRSIVRISDGKAGAAPREPRSTDRSP